MVDFGKLLKRGKKLVDEHGDQVASAVDKATDLVDGKTKGKYRSQLDKVDQAAQKLDNPAEQDQQGTRKPGETG
jgi:hypothetical protein